MPWFFITITIIACIFALVATEVTLRKQRDMIRLLNDELTHERMVSHGLESELQTKEERFSKIKDNFAWEVGNLKRQLNDLPESSNYKMIEGMRHRIEQLQLELQLANERTGLERMERTKAEREAEDATRTAKKAMTAVAGIQEAIVTMAKEAMRDGGTLVVAVHDPTAAQRMANAIARGEKPISANPNVTIKLEEILALWTCLAYYTKGAICHQPFPIAFEDRPKISTEQPVKKVLN